MYYSYKTIAQMTHFPSNLWMLLLYCTCLLTSISHCTYCPCYRHHIRGSHNSPTIFKHSGLYWAAGKTSKGGTRILSKHILQSLSWKWTS